MVYSIQDVIYQLENVGVFEILLPFFLIFAVVFGILSYMRIFGDNRGVHIVIAFVVGLMAVRLPYFNQFYRELFPRLGVGVTILLAVLILVGLFITKRNRGGIFIGLLAIGAVVAIVVIYEAFDYLGFTSYSGSDAVGWIIAAVIFIGIIIAVAASTGESADRRDEDYDLDRPVGAFGRRTK